MTTEIPMRILESGRPGEWFSSKDVLPHANSINDMAVDKLGLLLEGHTIQGDNGGKVPNRCGSAPPSMEGSFLAFQNLICQKRGGRNVGSASFDSTLLNCQSLEQIHADPSSFAYNCSNTNLNPRFHPPIISRENRQLDNYKFSSSDDSGDGSLHLHRSSLSTHTEEPEDDNSPSNAADNWAQNSTAELPVHKLGNLAGQDKSLADITQGGFPHTPSPVFSQSPSSNLVAVDKPTVCDIENNLSVVISESPETGSDACTEGSVGHGASSSNDASPVPFEEMSYVDVLGTPYTQLNNEEASSSPCLGGELTEGSTVADVYKKHAMVEREKIKDSESSNEKNVPESQHSYSWQNTAYHVTGPQVQIPGHGHPRFSSVEVPVVQQTSGLVPPLYATAAAYMSSGNQFYSSVNSFGVYPPQYNMGGYAAGSEFLPAYATGYPSHSGLPVHVDATAGQIISDQSTGLSTKESIPHVGDFQQINKFYGHQGLMLHPFLDPFQIPYFQHSVEDAFHLSGQYVNFPSTSVVGSQVNSYTLQKDPTLSYRFGDQNFQPTPSANFSVPTPRKREAPKNSYYGSPTSPGVVPQFPVPPLGSPILPGSPVGGASPFGWRNETRFSPGSGRNLGVYSGRQGQRGFDGVNDPKKYFLEDLKASNSRKIGLSDIVGRIAEFSVDQHGSRFIQQKLENCSIEDKVSVFKEVLPLASKLITDVFGNYVIQKFFEYGTHEQRKELASQLSGQILPLSLQMYGCRVIQKALEVIDLDQKTELVLELDGHVMKCVWDQNGNHVIQKCIECVPTEKIGFILSSFQGQVAMLSTHPYGCRVIQRVLEHCSNDSQSQCIVDEILESAYDLAQDQYGNYVTQHVLQRARPRERLQIIDKLAGKVVQLSQHKYASNVVEKCLEHGDSVERDLLIEEILAQSEGNDGLLTMLKDQFANYVVQKILEISNDKQRATLLNRIKVHLQSLRKYTYGKHIVARFEQLSGEETEAETNL